MELQFFEGKQCRVAVVEHSMNAHTGQHLYTYQARYPRIILAEVNTHRAISKSSGSSRAVPSKKLIAQIREEPAFFAHIGSNQPGMQADSEVDDEIKAKFKTEWYELANIVCNYVERWSNEYGIHKQVANRPTETFGYMNTVLSGTDWDNLFKLRAHPQAQPEFQDLAYTLLKAREASKPRHVTERALHDPRGWHLPYVTIEERKNYPIDQLLAMSAARNARVSYLNHNQEDPNIEEDVILYERLVKSEPLHASPTEHQAFAIMSDMRDRNFSGGWIQHRAILEETGSIEALKIALFEGMNPLSA